MRGPRCGFLYKYCRAKTALAILKSRQVKMASVRDFNDLDEGRFRVKWPSDDELRRHVEEEHSGQSGMYERGVERKRKFPDKPPPDVVGMVERMGISCFSEVRDDPLMWAHYADKHKGVCLGWRYKPVREAMERLFLRTDVVCLPMPVTYSDQFPVWEVGAGNYGINVPTTKARDWEYEKEWRIIAPESAGAFLPLPPDAFSHVILGAKTPKAQEERIISLASARPYNSNPSKPLYLQKARIADGERGIEFDLLRPNKSLRSTKRIIIPSSMKTQKSAGKD